ncbi:ECF transporter S component [Clostridiaceae bacterium HFYG-1003]|nr:ECF transporter S component [Clostridiaceae bacterium HFYG-1003]
MKKTSPVMIIVFAGLAVAINVVLGDLVALFKIPMLYLDTLGTIFMGVAFGPFFGALVGLATNLLMGVTASPTAIPFALVNIAVGIVSGLMAKRGFSMVTAVATGLILSVVAPLIGTPIRIFLFGGLTGSGADLLISALRASGQKIFASTFLATIASNFIDKILSCILVCMALAPIPLKYKPNVAKETGV